MTRVILTVLVAFAASPAFAQAYDRDGFAVGAGLSYAIEDFDDDGISFDNTGAGDAFASYRFHPNFGVEARFQQTFDFDGNAGPVDVDVDIWSLTANAQLFILTGQFQPFVGVGFGIGEADVDVDGPGFGGDDSTTDPLWRLSAGLDSYVTPNFVIGLEAAYNIGIDDLNDFDYFSLSALFRYRF